MPADRKRFVIACEVIDNVRLMKPHGMIPYTMGKHFGYDPEVVTYRHGDYPYAERELAGLKLRFLRPLLSKKAKLPFFWYLARNARHIDVLMVYNIKKRPIYYGLIYKLFNPGGFLYAKADTSWPRFGFYVDNAFFLYKRWMRWLGGQFLRRCNAVSVESRPVYDAITQIDRDKLLLIPCGIDPEIVERLGVQRRPFADKENLVLHVARMGVPQKNSELLLDAIVQQRFPDDWRFAFVGAQTPAFRQRVERFCREHPDKAARVEFREHITDKHELYDYYSRAKVFCLPSRRETFGNVLVEAQYFGNVIAGSAHLPSVQDLIDGGRAGVTFDADSPDDLAAQLQSLMHAPQRLASMSDAANRYAEQHLIWAKALAPLHEKIRLHYARP